MALTKLIGTVTTLTLTAILLWISFNQNFILTSSGDMTCSGTPVYSELFKVEISDCQVFWNITSINYTYYFRNKEGIKLDFTPEVKGYEMFVKDGRYKSGWKVLDKSGNFTYKKGVKYQFMAFIFKEINQTIKWTITAADVSKDPVLFGININAIQDCQTTTKIITQNIEKTKILLLNTTFCKDFPINKSCVSVNTKNQTVPYIAGSYDYFQNTTICENVGLNVNNKIINYTKFGWKCSLNENILECDSMYDGNSNGKCTSGESCTKIDIRDLSLQERLDTSSLKHLKIE